MLYPKPKKSHNATHVSGFVSARAHARDSSGDTSSSYSRGFPLPKGLSAKNSLIESRPGASSDNRDSRPVCGDKKPPNQELLAGLVVLLRVTGNMNLASGSARDMFPYVNDDFWPTPRAAFLLLLLLLLLLTPSSKALYAYPRVWSADETALRAVGLFGILST